MELQVVLDDAVAVGRLSLWCHLQHGMHVMHPGRRYPNREHLEWRCTGIQTRCRLGQIVGLLVWPPIWIEDLRMRPPLLWVGERFWETNPRRSCHQVGSCTNYDVTATYVCGRLYVSQCSDGRITRYPPLHHIWWGVRNTIGTWNLGSWNLDTWLAVAQCTIFLPHL